MDGFETLRWIRRQPGLKSLGVVVLTSLQAMCDVNEAYRLGANSLDFVNFVTISKLIRHYWLEIDKAPEVSHPAEVRASNLIPLPGQPLTKPEALEPPFVQAFLP